MFQSKNHLNQYAHLSMKQSHGLQQLVVAKGDEFSEAGSSHLQVCYAGSIPNSSEALHQWIGYTASTWAQAFWCFLKTFTHPEKLRTLTCSITLSSRPIMVWAMWKQGGHWWILFDHFTNMPSLVTKSCSHGGSAFILSSMCINGIFSSTLRYTKYTFA